MSNTITKTIRQSGDRNHIVDVYILGDGSGEETDTVLIDFSAIANAYGYTDLALTKYISSLTGFSCNLAWDASTNVPFLEIPEGDSGFDYTMVGGPLNDNSGTGKTGDVNITTVGLGSGDRGTIRLEFKKHNGALVV